jgi:cobalt/nickel transport system ATP-binding protein
MAPVKTTPAGPPAIQARGLSFAYEEGTLALDDVDFHVARGEFVALLASNGSGKTTLLKAVAKLLKTRKGEVAINGRNLRETPDSELYQQVGVVLQNPDDQLFAPTVGEDVAYGPRNLGLSEEEVEERVRQALSQVGAEGLRERAIHHLSYGEKKRVCVAGVLAMRPSILMLDEPTAGLDPAGEHQMMHLLQGLNRSHGITIVMATHSVDLLPLFTDRIYVLKNGRVLKVGTPEEVFGDREVVDSARLRLPYITTLIHELKCYNGVPIDGLPLTIKDARERLAELIPPDILIRGLKRQEG